MVTSLSLSALVLVWRYARRSRHPSLPATLDAPAALPEPLFAPTISRGDNA
jgi:hypothetical protein